MTGLVDPVDSVRGKVVELLREDGIDVSGRTPRMISPADITDAVPRHDGISIEQFRSEGKEGEARQWDIAASGGETPASYRLVCDEIRERVDALFDELSSGFASRLHPS